MRAVANRLFKWLLTGITVCALPLTMLFSPATMNDKNLGPREKLLAILATWRGRILIAIDVCLSILGTLGR